jgi:hypothetical protein
MQWSEEHISNVANMKHRCATTRFGYQKGLGDASFLTVVMRSKVE